MRFTRKLTHDMCYRYGIDAQTGERIEALTPRHWQGASLSSALRALSPPQVPVLQALPFLDREEQVRAFLRAATKRFAEGASLGLLPEIGYGTHTLCELLCALFLRTRRLRRGIELFSSMQSAYPSIALHVARAYAKRQQLHVALAVLSRSLYACP